MSLVTLTDMKTYLGETTTNYDTFLQAQLDLYSSVVENYCGRKFESASYTQTFYKNNFDSQSKKLPLYHYPIISVATVSEITSYEGTDTSTSVFTSYEYRINAGEGSLYKLSGGALQTWFAGICFDTRVEVEYTAGYATIPLEIDAVVKRLVEEDYNKKKSNVPLNLGPEIQSIAIPGVMNIAYDYSLQANERTNKFGMLIGNYSNVLDSFRSDRAVIGELRDNYVV